MRRSLQKFGEGGGPVELLCVMAMSYGELGHYPSLPVTIIVCLSCRKVSPLVSYALNLACVQAGIQDLFILYRLGT